jgi:cytochrome c-type biogenesis protein CcmH
MRAAFSAGAHPVGDGRGARPLRHRPRGGLLQGQDGGMTDTQRALRALVWAWVPIGMAVLVAGAATASPGAQANAVQSPRAAVQASPLAQAVSDSAPAALPAVQAAASLQSVAPMSPAVQARWDHIAAELRCLVCQNESLASSNAELALDLRRELRSLIEQGQSDDDIRSFLVSRYGDFVLYKPEVKPVTWLLWFGPFVLLLGALVLALRLIRRTTVAPAPLTDRERERARQLLES